MKSLLSDEEENNSNNNSKMVKNITNSKMHENAQAVGIN